MLLKRTWAYLSYVVTEYGRDNCGQLAAAISYYVLFSIVPFTLLVVSLFGLVAGGRQLQQEVTPVVVDFIGLRQGEALISVDADNVEAQYGPSATAEIRAALSAMSLQERELIADRLTVRDSGPVTIAGRELTSAELVVRYDNGVSNALADVASLSAPLTILGAAVMVWSASAMFGAVRRAMNAVWRVDRQKPYFQQKLQDLAMAGVVGAFLLVSVAGTGALRALRELSDDALGPLSTETGFLWEALPYILPFFVSIPVFILTYRYVPASRVVLRDTLLGASVAALMFEVLKNAFAFYVANFRAYDIIYGSLGGILLFLTSVYFSAAILLIGAEMTAAYPLLANGRFDPVVDPSAPRKPWIVRAARDVYSFVRGLFLAPHRPAGTRGNPPATRQR